nr:hypothetical protein [Pandoravirus massiliensis]
MSESSRLNPASVVNVQWPPMPESVERDADVVANQYGEDDPRVHALDGALFEALGPGEGEDAHLADPLFGLRTAIDTEIMRTLAYHMMGWLHGEPSARLGVSMPQAILDELQARSYTVVFEPGTEEDVHPSVYEVFLGVALPHPATPRSTRGCVDSGRASSTGSTCARRDTVPAWESTPTRQRSSWACSKQTAATLGVRAIASSCSSRHHDKKGHAGRKKAKNRYPVAGDRSGALSAVVVSCTPTLFIEQIVFFSLVRSMPMVYSYWTFGFMYVDIFVPSRMVGVCAPNNQMFWPTGKELSTN